ncbi:hypothetical protein HPP92_019021 [Vanilla planifolia]|uniref:Uncharacterized protein n=1 Tax=Vanilla planifolia TaxID=51239 RepID=A0A835UPX9_VANPL|nr:hypothetical protein HPP92_019021 [Vanilla planifolia]
MEATFLYLQPAAALRMGLSNRALSALLLLLLILPSYAFGGRGVAVGQRQASWRVTRSIIGRRTRLHHPIGRRMGRALAFAERWAVRYQTTRRAVWSGG